MLNKAFNYLKVRDRTEQELRNKLAEVSADNDAIDTVILELEAMGFVDDQKFANNFARLRLNTKHQGPIRIKMELKKLGVGDEYIFDALQELTQTAKVSAATEYLRARSWRLNKYSQNDQKYKAKQLLFSRGFSSDTIRLAIDEFFTQE